MVIDHITSDQKCKMSWICQIYPCKEKLQKLEDALRETGRRITQAGREHRGHSVVKSFEKLLKSFKSWANWADWAYRADCADWDRDETRIIFKKF